MKHEAEQILLLSVKILKITSRQTLAVDRKGILLQKFATCRSVALGKFDTSGNSLGDNLRLAIARYFNQQAKVKIRAQI